MRINRSITGSIMSLAGLIILILATIILQSTLVPYISINNIKPDLFNGLFILLVLQFSNIQSIILAFIIGAVKDLYTNHQYGLEIIALIIPALILPIIVKKTDISNIFVRFMVLYLFSLISLLIVLIEMAIIEKSFITIKIFYSNAIGAALYTSVISLIVFHFIKRIIPFKTDQYELF